MITVILAHTKYGDELIRGEDGTLESAALKLLEERVKDGYWYRGEDQAEAQGIVDVRAGKAAWRFLESRSDNEYESVEARTL